MWPLKNFWIRKMHVTQDRTLAVPVYILPVGLLKIIRPIPDPDPYPRIDIGLPHSKSPHPSLASLVSVPSRLISWQLDIQCNSINKHADDDHDSSSTTRRSNSDRIINNNSSRRISAENIYLYTSSPNGWYQEEMVLRTK